VGFFFARFFRKRGKETREKYEKSRDNRGFFGKRILPNSLNKKNYIDFDPEFESLRARHFYHLVHHLADSRAPKPAN
jgi:hypothetical protein